MKTNRWKARPLHSAGLRMLVVLVPSCASFAVGLLVSRKLPQPVTLSQTVLWWVALGGASLAALFVVERLVRRLGPLAVLLNLSLAFPGQAPSRFRVARQAGRVRDLQARLERLRREGGDQEQAEAAETILALATALSAHDRHTRGHSERVRVFTDMLAVELHIEAESRDRLRWAALLHDVGKLSVPARILKKDGSLQKGEWDAIREHPEEGMRLITPLIPWLGEWAEAISQHHERFDGTGYPAGLVGEQICLGARIVSVADAYDAITSLRSYRKPVSPGAALEELARQAGTQFDPRVVRALLSISTGRLWWRVGIWSWLAQLPILGLVPRALGRSGVLEGSAAAASRTAVATVTAVGMVGSASPLAQASRDARPRAAGSRYVIAVEGREKRALDSSEGRRRGRAIRKNSGARMAVGKRSGPVGVDKVLHDDADDPPEHPEPERADSSGPGGGDGAGSSGSGDEGNAGGSGGEEDVKEDSGRLVRATRDHDDSDDNSGPSSSSAPGGSSGTGGSDSSESEKDG